MSIAVILAAAGSGSRMGGQPKPLIPLAGKTVLEWSLQLFAGDSRVCQILVLCPEEQISIYQQLTAPYRNTQVLPGGATRSETVSRAGEFLSSQADLVAIHDAARPLLTAADWQSLVAAGEKYPAVIASGAVVDTIKLVEGDTVQQGLPRHRLAAAQTPQMFHRDLFLDICRQPANSATDEAEIAEALGAPIHIIRTQDENFKITYAEDIPRALAVLAGRNSLSPALPGISSMANQPSLRIGCGWDRHRLEPGLPLVLAGHSIESPLGSVGHSDGDPLCHALIDALLGAAALGDIGAHFPDTDPAYKGICSLRLLEICRDKLKEAGWQPVNVDTNILLQKPKLLPHMPIIRQNIAQALELPLDRVSVKAKTGEKIGPVGEGLVIEAQATAMIERIIIK